MEGSSWMQTCSGRLSPHSCCLIGSRQLELFFYLSPSCSRPSSASRFIIRLNAKRRSEIEQRGAWRPQRARSVVLLLSPASTAPAGTTAATPTPTAAATTLPLRALLRRRCPRLPALRLPRIATRVGAAVAAAEKRRSRIPAGKGGGDGGRARGEIRRLRVKMTTGRSNLMHLRPP